MRMHFLLELHFVLDNRIIIDLFQSTRFLLSFAVPKWRLAAETAAR